MVGVWWSASEAVGEQQGDVPGRRVGSSQSEFDMSRRAFIIASAVGVVPSCRAELWNCECVVINSLYITSCLTIYDQGAKQVRTSE